MPMGRIGQELIVNSTVTGSQFDPSITALADSRFVVTRTHSDGVDQNILGRIFNSDGSVAGNDFPINTTTANVQSMSSVTALTDGRFVVTWRSLGVGINADIRAPRLQCRRQPRPYSQHGRRLHRQLYIDE
ncbi:hypothetical protein ACG873_15170 [Mesorhizobium sp. AaZ16]|uniref:hypothetical protein n=1 Tax=Mesorhizobium sp. AaZ16 TaxID=3402289 RepID=UPI00374FBE58